MYPVTNAYKAAMHSKVQQFKISGTVGDTAFTEANVLAGSLSISNQCSGSDNIEIGQVYIGELNCTFIGLDIERYSWYGKEITLQFGQKIAVNLYEYIPLGVFTIAEANYTASGVVVKAYDHMAKLDKHCSSLSTGATPYILVKKACDECKVALETTEREFSRFPNGGTTLGLFAENDISTYRDVLSWVAQTCACFVTASRTGGIVFKTYGGEPVDTIDDEHRFTGCSFSDFSTRYTGMSVVNIEKQTTTYYAVSPDDGLTYNLGSNPYLQNEISHSLTTMRTAVLNKLAEIDYVPFKATCIGNPAYDLGDVLIFSEGLADGTKQSVITKYTWNYGQSYSMEGVGKNPALATGNSKSDKNISGLISQASKDSFSCMVLRNGSDVNIADGESKSVIFSRYLITSPSHVRFNFEVLLTVTTNENTDNHVAVIVSDNILTLIPVSTPSHAVVTIDDDVLTLTPVSASSQAVVTAIYKADGEEIVTRYPIETWASGKHILTLQYDLDHDDELSHTFDLWLSVSGGSVSIKAQDAYEVITSAGLAADSTWEGTFRGEDKNLYVVINGQAHKIPDKIAVHTYPTKVAYQADEPIDYTGLSIHAVFGDGSEMDITSDCVLDPTSGTPFDTAEDTYVEVSYTAWTVEYGTGFDLTYNYVTGLNITPPTKINYKYGEILDYTGLAVELVYRDGSTKDITDECTITPAEGEAFDYYNN